MADSIEYEWKSLPNSQSKVYIPKYKPPDLRHRSLRICIPCNGCNIQHEFLIGEVPKLCPQCWREWLDDKDNFGCTYREWVAQRRPGGLHEER